MSKVTSLLLDQAVLQIVNVTLRDIRYVIFTSAYYTVGMAAAICDCLFCDQHQ